jgi:hypothetical protein
MSRIQLVGILLPIALACASGPDANAPRTPVLVPPLNFDSPPDEHLIEGLTLLRAELVKQLEEEGFVVASVSLAAAIEDWRRAVDEVGGLRISDESDALPEQVQAARGAMARRLLTDRAERVVLFPSFVVRRARTWKTSATWDGVSQKVRIPPGLGISRDKLRLSGGILASSLLTSAYSPNGSLLEEAYGGIELLTRIQPRGIDLKYFEHKRVSYFDWVDRDDLFEDPDRIEEAVELSLEPVLAALRAE